MGKGQTRQDFRINFNSSSSLLILKTRKLFFTSIKIIKYWREKLWLRAFFFFLVFILWQGCNKKYPSSLKYLEISRISFRWRSLLISYYYYLENKKQAETVIDYKINLYLSRLKSFIKITTFNLNFKLIL